MSSCIPTHPLVESDHILQKCILNSSRLTYLSRMPSADLTSEPAKKSLHIPLKLLQTQICDGVCVCVLCVCVCVLTTNMSQTLVVPLRGRAWTQRDPTRAHTHTHTHSQRDKNKRTSGDTNLTEPTVGGHDLLPLVLKQTGRRFVDGWRYVWSSLLIIEIIPPTLLMNRIWIYGKVVCDVCVCVCFLTTLMSWARDTWM